MEQTMGKVIQAKRRAKGMTQEQLGQLLLRHGFGSAQ